MLLFQRFSRFLCRFRYPVSLPEDVAKDLGMCLSNHLSFKEFIHILLSSSTRPSKLRRFMSREKAEATFKSALKKETFQSITLFSYYFSQGWVIIALYFNEDSRLTRLHLECPACTKMEGRDLPLVEEPFYAKASSQ